MLDIRQKNKKGNKGSRAILILISYVLILVSGCKTHYSFSGASIPPEAKTVSVEYFQNNASLAPPTLSQTFTEALRDKLSSLMK